MKDSQVTEDPTKGPSDSTAGQDPRLVAAVQEYLAAVEAGQRPSRQELLSRYPDIAEDLSACLQGLAFVNSAAAQMKGETGHSSAEPESGIEGDMAMAKPLGDFKLVREIGRGGMGVVYEAQQLSLGRRVAVKVLSFAAALDPRHLQRFRNEAQAAAQLHHTNIVPVYAVGCERSVHFYAMQLIEGQSLADVIRELRRAAGQLPQQRDKTNQGLNDASGSWHPPKSYPPSDAPAQARITSRERLAAIAQPPPAESLSTMRGENRRITYFQAVARLGLQAAEALDYAHNMGVVHRDIKPANLLLDVRGNLWITDFGLAQFYAMDTGLTQTGDLLGTFRYMSPEQASGRAVVLDQRTDIYSLGVTLYELLTLERALPGKTREQLLHEIDSVDPRAMRTIDRAIPPELETIINKAIAKDPVDRYATARAFSDDLARFLRDEPILARPPSLWDKSVKWTRRHKALALSAMVMLTIIAAGLLVTTLLVAREQGKTKTALEEKKKEAIEANDQRALAEKSFREARDAVDFFTRVAAQQMGNKPEFADLRKEMLEASLAYYQNFLDERRDDPSISAQLNTARQSISSILSELFALDEFFRAEARVKLVVQQSSIQQELQLSTDKIEALQRYYSGIRKSGRFDPNLSSEQNRDRFTTLRGKVEQELAQTLTPEQTSRLRQIAWQVEGPRAFSDPAVVDSLLLSKQQKEVIQAIITDYKNALFHPPRPNLNFRGRQMNPQERFEEDQREAQRQSTLRRQAMKKVYDNLSPEQLEIWQSMIGDPFTGEVVERIFGGPGGGPGGPGGGPGGPGGGPGGPPPG